MVLRDGRVQLPETEERGRLNHINVIFEAGWEAVFKGSEGFLVGSRSHYLCQTEKKEIVVINIHIPKTLYSAFKSFSIVLTLA